MPASGPLVNTAKQSGAHRLVAVLGGEASAGHAGHVIALTQILAKGVGSSRPSAEAASDHVADHSANILPLGRIIVRPRVIAGSGQSPTAFLESKALQESRGIVDILMWVEHCGHGAEMAAMIIIVDLHAADIDQLGAGSSGLLETLQSLIQRAGKIGSAFNI